MCMPRYAQTFLIKRAAESGHSTVSGLAQPAARVLHRPRMDGDSPQAASLMEAAPHEPTTFRALADAIGSAPSWGLGYSRTPRASNHNQYQKKRKPKGNGWVGKAQGVGLGLEPKWQQADFTQCVALPPDLPYCS